MTKKPTTILALTLGMGGVGKTTAAIAIANRLADKNIKRAIYECDQDNIETSKGIAHWLEGSNNTLDLRNPKHRDRLLTETADSGAQVVLCDLPANSAGDLAKWIRTVATAETINKMGIKVIAVCPVTPTQGGSGGVIKWASALRERAHYLVVLNRIDYEMYEEPTREAFSDWYDVALPMLSPNIIAPDRIHVIELPNMEKHAWEAIKLLKMLPSKALSLDDETLNLLHKQRITDWTQSIDDQLTATGLFPSAKESKSKEQSATA